MARVMRPADVLFLAHSIWPAHLAQREKAIKLDQWAAGKQQAIEDIENSGLPFMPAGRATVGEYRDIAGRAPTNWAGFLVDSIAQTCRLDGIYVPGSSDSIQSWSLWQENRWDGRQGALYRGAFKHGQSFATALPAVSQWTKKRTAKFEALSAKKMSVYYQAVEDEFPMYSLDAERHVDINGQEYWTVRFIDEEAEHFLEVKHGGLDRKEWTYISYEEHGLGFCPVIQYGQMDLDGTMTGEIEPFIPLLRRIDQDVFDRLVVQRFGAWVIRYGTGLVKPETDEDQRAAAMLLRMGELLVAEGKDAKFGTLSATELKGFIEAHDADLRILSAVSQRPPHHMLGAASNLQAEALAATEQGLARRGGEWRTGFGESHELLFRTGAVILGNTADAQNFNMQVRWKDTESRSLSQTADALGKIATQLQVPVEMLWEQIPGFTDSDVERAKSILSSRGLSQLLAELAAQDSPGAEEDPVVDSGRDA